MPVGEDRSVVEGRIGDQRDLVCALLHREAEQRVLPGLHDCAGLGKVHDLASFVLVEGLPEAAEDERIDGGCDGIERAGSIRLAANPGDKAGKRCTVNDRIDQQALATGNIVAGMDIQSERGGRMDQQRGSTGFRPNFRLILIWNDDHHVALLQRQARLPVVGGDGEQRGRSFL